MSDTPRTDELLARLDAEPDSDDKEHALPRLAYQLERELAAFKAQHTACEFAGTAIKQAQARIAELEQERDALRFEYAKVEQLWKQASIDLDRTRTTLHGLENAVRISQQSCDALRKDALRWRHERMNYQYPGTYGDHDISCLADLEQAIDAATQEQKP